MAPDIFFPKGAIVRIAHERGGVPGSIARVALIVVLACLQACGSGTGNGQREGAPTPMAVAPSLEQLHSAEVGGIFDGPAIRLTNGVYEGAPYATGGAARPRVTLLSRMTAAGMLDTTAGEKRVALLAGSSGGTGVNIYLAVFGVQRDEVANLGTTLVGDRVQLRGLQLQGRSIVLDVVRAGPQDAMCCPTELARMSYRLGADGLRKSSDEVTGKLSLAALAGVEWTLDEVDGTPLAPAARRPTLQIAGATTSGFGGCNRYTGPVTESQPGKIAFGNLAATRMACDGPQMDIEDAYFRDLARVESYVFLEGRLGLAWQDGERRGLLLFRR